MSVYNHEDALPDTCVVALDISSLRSRAGGVACAETSLEMLRTTRVCERHSSRSKKGQKCRVSMESWQLTI